MSRYRLSSLAEADLDRIWWQLAEDATIATADRVVEAIVERFALLARHRAAGASAKTSPPESGALSSTPTLFTTRKREITFLSPACSTVAATSTAPSNKKRNP